MSVDPRGFPVSQLVALFNATFEQSDRTVLQGGGDEPYYVPGEPHRIFFRQDFVRSALHEVAHWCVAGECRRALPDYGYWYSPDGRDAGQQLAFFAVEARPQAIERNFCEAIGIPFSPSVDNVGVQIERRQLCRFEARIEEWFNQFERSGLPPRAAQFVIALQSMTRLSQGSAPDIAG